ncbi:hypothetical protein MKZ38_009561 [Zalerion maritima]|uniref:Uncharacterized protein n=1 Tax=Zalerion maritima TaxID=339359 RepID=A0AAD5RT57_9PEZI|nr:hypothetical protein MKZ38_009561 [Zalerion maritima]
MEGLGRLSLEKFAAWGRIMNSTFQVSEGYDAAYYSLQVYAAAHRIYVQQLEELNNMKEVALAIFHHHHHPPSYTTLAHPAE